jgi:hypothetical protein
LKKYVLAAMLFFLIVGISGASHAILYEGIRPLGMGNAFTALADDENAVFYNPAGLSKVSTVTVGLLNPKISVARDSIDLIKDAEDTDFDETGEVAALLRQYTGKAQHLSVGLFPHVGVNISDAGVLFGVLAHSAMNVQIRNPAWPQSQVELNADLGPVLGAGFKVPAAEGLSVGMAVKYIYRNSLNEVYTPAQIASDNFEDIIEDDFNSGSGFSLDIGAIYDINQLVPFFDSTRIGIAGLNLPNRSMGNAASIKHQFNVGIAAEKSLLPWCTLIGAFDVHDITQSAIDESQLSRRIHIGAELQFPMVSLRTGINDGYWSAGTTLDARIFKLDLATYKVEQGAYAGQKDDRRYIAQIHIGW